MSFRGPAGGALGSQAWCAVERCLPAAGEQRPQEAEVGFVVGSWL